MLKNKLKFIGIGAYKCGTTWLAQCLREHPDICIPRIKEVEFFSKKFKNGGFVYSHYDKGTDWYEKQFDECEDNVSCMGEFSNAYLYDKDSAKLIKKTLPNIKLLLCLRNPVDRAYSEYLWDKLNFKRGKYKGIIMEEIKSGDYVEHGLYGKYIKRYLELFDLNDIHVVLFDDILHKPREVMKGVYSFLKVKPFPPPSLMEKINPASKARIGWFTHVFDLRIKLEEKKFGVIIDLLKKAKLYNFIQNAYVKVNRAPIDKKPLTEQQRNELKDLFLDDISLTEKLLKVHLSAWK